VKKLFLILWLIGLVGCNNQNDNIIEVNFISETTSAKVEILKGDSISYNNIPDDYKSIVKGLYYDANFTNEYNDEPISDDISIYMVLLDGLNQNTASDIIDSYMVTYCDTDTLVEDIYIEQYFGEYNDSYVFLMNDKMRGDTGIIMTYTIDEEAANFWGQIMNNNIICDQ